MAILVTRLATAVASFQAEKHQNSNKSRFPGATCIFSKSLMRDKNEELRFCLASDLVKSTARFGAPKIASYGHFGCHPAGHGRFKPKNTQNGNKSRFPGGRAFSANVASTFDKNEDARISCSSFLSLATFAENARGAPGNRDLLPFWVFFGLATAVASRVTKMAITRFLGIFSSETKFRGTARFDHRMRNF